MPADALFDGIPDLVVLLRRDGVIIAHGGGHGLTELVPAADCLGKRLDTVWPEPFARLVRQLARRAIALRASTEARLQDGKREYEVRASAQGPDRALLIIRAPLSGAGDESLESSDERPRPQLDRRGFLRRFKESMSLAALREKPAAVAVIHVDGIADIAQLIAGKLSEQIMSAAILRLPGQFESAHDGNPGSAVCSAGAQPVCGDQSVPGGQRESAPTAGGPAWYLGQLSDTLLALVFETADRDVIETCVAQVCDSLREPVEVGEALFHLTPYAGVAILGQDAASPKLLLDHARSAANEARRSGTQRVCFFTDTLSLRSLMRLDIARELREAIENRDIRLRYIGRHDLVSGRVLAWVGYLRWLHPLRGEIRPDEFVRVAEATGLATALSRAVLSSLQEDFAHLGSGSERDVRISFGALRHHVLHEHFVQDIREFLAAGTMPAERLELRISEKALIARAPTDLQALSDLGVRLVVDEVGRGLGSLDWLARAPIWGLQLDRAWTTALRTDEIALKVCRAGVGVARALGLTPVATGVDNEQQRDALLKIGCLHGSGDLYRQIAPDIILPLPHAKPG